MNASSRTSRYVTHDSGPAWLAISLLLRTFTFYSLRSLPAHIAVGTSIAGCPRTDPGGRDSRTGLPPRVVNDESHEQLRVHSRASGTRLSGAVSGTCVALPCFPRSSPLAPPTPPPVAQVCSSSIELHAWRSAETCTFATFVYAKSPERLLRHFTGSDENEVIRQALVWCEENSGV